MEENLNLLISKIQKLERKINSLRVGRRILMSLLIDQEKKKNQEITKLKEEIKKLRKTLKNRQ